MELRRLCFKTCRLAAVFFFCDVGRDGYNAEQFRNRKTIKWIIRVIRRFSSTRLVSSSEISSRLEEHALDVMFSFFFSPSFSDTRWYLLLFAIYTSLRKPLATGRKSFTEKKLRNRRSCALLLWINLVFSCMFSLELGGCFEVPVGSVRALIVQSKPGSHGMLWAKTKTKYNGLISKGMPIRFQARNLCSFIHLLAWLLRDRQLIREFFGLH